MHSKANLLPLSVFKKLRFFLRKTNLFPQEGANFSTFWEILLIQLQPETTFTSLAVFKKITIFFRKTHKFHLKKKFLNVLRSLTFSVAFYGKIASFSAFEKNQVFFGKTHRFFFQTKATFWRFQKTYFFLRFLVLICYL